MGTTVHLNQAALARLLESREIKDACTALGEQVADRVRTQGIDVEHIPGDIDLPVGVFENSEGVAVIIAHPSGLAVQAKDGALTRAAAALGLEVHG